MSEIMTDSKHQRYRLKDLDGYRAKKREYARTPEQREKRTAYMRIWRERNREKHNSWSREYHRKKAQENPEAVALSRRAQRYKIKYGITLEQYEQMLVDQGGACLICKRPPKNRRLHVDHDHKTGEVRGLLCSPCNTKLGWYEAFSSSIVDYLA